MVINPAELPPLNRADDVTPIPVRVAAQYLAAHPQSVYRWIREGRLPRHCYYKRARKIWFTPRSILATLDLWQQGPPVPVLPSPKRLRTRPRRQSFEVDARVSA